MKICIKNFKKQVEQKSLKLQKLNKAIKQEA